MPGADTLFAASPKLLTPSPLREPGGVAQFAAPPAPPPTYCPAPTGALPLPSLLRLTRDDAAALPDCCEWLPDAEGCAETIVVGTAHVSDASVAEVAAAIAALRPDAVLLEICSGRTQMLEKIDLSAPPNLEQMLKQIQDGADLFSVVYPWFLATVAESLEVVPGAEFRAGFLAAAALSEGQVLYGQDPETQERKLLGYMNEADAIERTRETLLGADTAQPHEQLVLPRPRDGEEQELSQEQQLWVALYNARAACACPVVLADRHINATVSRVWGSLTPWDRVRLLGSFAWQVTHTHAHATHTHVCTHLTSD
jgi:pheromone shutdown protein TraB